MLAWRSPSLWSISLCMLSAKARSLSPDQGLGLDGGLVLGSSGPGVWPKAAANCSAAALSLNAKPAGVVPHLREYQPPFSLACASRIIYASRSTRSAGITTNIWKPRFVWVCSSMVTLPTCAGAAFWVGVGAGVVAVGMRQSALSIGQ